MYLHQFKGVFVVLGGIGGRYVGIIDGVSLKGVILHFQSIALRWCFGNRINRGLVDIDLLKLGSFGVLISRLGKLFNVYNCSKTI